MVSDRTKSLARLLASVMWWHGDRVSLLQSRITRKLPFKILVFLITLL